MKVTALVLSTTLALNSIGRTNAFSPTAISLANRVSSVSSTVATDTPDVNLAQSLTMDVISKLQFREAKRELNERNLDDTGTLTAMRQRLRGVVAGMTTSLPPVDDEIHTIDQDTLNEAFEDTGISFQDQSDPDFDFKNIMSDVTEKAQVGHWKSAIRKMRYMTKTYGKDSTNPRPIPFEVYDAVLQSCMLNRLQGARAAESARRILELMVDEGYEITSEVANSCIQNSLDDGPDGTHDGFGGIDTALAMMSAVGQAKNSPVINEDTYSHLVSTMAHTGEIEISVTTLKEMVVDQKATPSLEVFADVAMACVSGKGRTDSDAEQVMTVLSYAKAAGYVLDNIASTEEGRNLLAAGVVAAVNLKNVGLGLRFLTAASKAEGCEPDRGDSLVANSSPAAQRASTILHREAINRATRDMAWKLSVKLLELMLARGLTPSPSVWRNVVVCCAKAEKSRKATSILLDWIELSKQGRAEKPNIRMFNTVVNACEVCGEEELTVTVLDAMKATHETEGNLITFNIALKRLAKQGNTMACEGIVIGMLQSGIEPSVVSYTTAIASCVAEPKRSDTAMEWIHRMRSRLVQPNVITYNTAFASCLDGTLAGSERASQLAAEMVVDIQKQVDSGNIDGDLYTNIIPNFYTRTLAREAMKQLKGNWDNGDIDRTLAKQTLRKPLLQLVEFMKTDLAELAEKQKTMVAQISGNSDATESAVADVDEELEYSTAISSHRAAAV